MSYIHQALKKAQTERDDRYGNCEEIPHRSRSNTSVSFIRRTLIGVAALGILFLAFISYSWLDLSRPQATTQALPQSKHAVPDPGPVPDKTANADAFYPVAKTHHRSGQVGEAKLFYEKALKADPGCVAALNNLGVILMTQKNYPEAQDRFEKAIRLRPAYVDPCYNLACLFALTNEPEQGIRYLKRAISLDPQVKAWAREDADMETLRNEPGFAKIVDQK